MNPKIVETRRASASCEREEGESVGAWLIFDGSTDQAGFSRSTPPTPQKSSLLQGYILKLLYFLLGKQLGR